MLLGLKFNYCKFKVQYQFCVKYKLLYLTLSAGVLELADSYCEKELKKRCEKLIWQNVTTDNVATLMTVASKYRTNVRTVIIVIIIGVRFFPLSSFSLSFLLLSQALEEQCMSFALSHMTQVIQSDAFDQLDCSVAKEFVKKVAERGAFKT